MAALTDERLQQELAAARNHRFEELVRHVKRSQLSAHETGIIPNLPDLLSFGILDNFFNASLHIAIEPQVFDEYLTRMSILIPQWRTRIYQQLLAKLRPLDASGQDEHEHDAAGDLGSPLDRLKSATSAFWCKNCTPWYRQLGRFPPLLFYPGVLFHKCFRHEVSSFSELNVDGDRGGFPAPLPRSVFNMDRVVGAPISPIIRSVVSTCGLDPSSATTAEMDALDVRLRCLRCCEWEYVKTRYQRPPAERREIGSDRRLIMDWRTAVCVVCRTADLSLCIVELNFFIDVSDLASHTATL